MPAFPTSQSATLSGVTFAHAQNITPSDNANLTNYAQALYIGGAGSGNLKVITVGGETIALTGIAVGWLWIAVSKIFATGTDVTKISGYW